MWRLTLLSTTEEVGTTSRGALACEGVALGSNLVVAGGPDGVAAGTSGSVRTTAGLDPKLMWTLVALVSGASELFPSRELLSSLDVIMSMKLVSVCCWLKLSVLVVGAAGFLSLDVAVTAASEVILGGRAALIDAPALKGALLVDSLGRLAENGSLSDEFTERIGFFSIYNTILIAILLERGSRVMFFLRMPDELHLIFRNWGTNQIAQKALFTCVVY